MIDQSLILLQNELQAYLNSFGDNATVVLENIALWESGDSAANLQNSVVITLVNIEEESALKNIKAFHKSPITGQIEYENPPVHLNLYLLFSANYSNNYESALLRLSRIVQFFQAKKIFTPQNSPNASILNDANFNEPDLINFKLILDLYTLTFEQLNHLWGSLGGKQLPAVMYKGRLIRIKERKVEQTGPPITEIDVFETAV